MEASCARATCSRYGGEEFVVLASDTDLLGADHLAEKLRMTIAEQSLILGDSMRPTRITVSIGVATFRGNRQRFFSAADQALYRAKASGKNCVMVDDEKALQKPSTPDERFAEGGRVPCWRRHIGGSAAASARAGTISRQLAALG
jgi:predicted signal transduction protein with EAL and GGDEF domain